MSRRLEVLLHGQVVGYLAEAAGGGTTFRLSDAYRELVPRPVLGQRFEDDLERVHRSRPRQGLPDFFANLIPEGRLREVIERSAGLEAGDDLGLLAFVGPDLPGAVVVREATEGAEEASADEAGQGLDGGENGEPPAEGLRFSLAGVQLKFSMLREGEKLVLPASGQSGEWIVKLDSPSWPSLPENEWAMLTWARAAGFEVPECRLHDAADLARLPVDLASLGGRVLAVRRYDRGPEGRIHQEDFAQAIGRPPTKKYDGLTYEAMAHLVRRFIDEEAVDELIRRLVLVVATGNNDAHLKNWSLVYPDRVRARWSPLYDQVATVAWPGPDRRLALKLAGVKELVRVDRAAFERFGEKAGVDRERLLREVDATLERLLAAWKEVGPDLPFPAAHRTALREHWRAVPLLRAAGALE